MPGHPSDETTESDDVAALPYCVCGGELVERVPERFAREDNRNDTET